MNEIKLLVKPEISHKLKELGASVTKRIEELNVGSLIATEDTLKTLKSLRADLNKELDNYEEQRKFVKNGILNPYNEFEALYKTEISEKYKNAIDTLKDKIGTVENKVKAEKKERIKSYFDELCHAEKIDFVPFDKLGLDINLSTTEKAYKEKCNEFIKKVQDDLFLISTSDHQAETLTEYKLTLNASNAITTVRTRKENEKAEAERLHAAEVIRRTKEVVASGLAYDEFTKSYAYNDDIFITESFIRSSNKEEYTTRLIECQERIKEVKAAAQPAETKQSKMQFTAPKPAEAIQAPVVKEATEKLVTASFTVTGTMAQLKTLGQYMRENNITYKNI